MAEFIDREEMEEDDDIISLRGADGEEINFIDIAGIALSHGYYNILQPVELLPDMADDEALVFKVEELEDGTYKYDFIQDDAIIDEVFAEYNRLLDKIEEEGDDNN